MKPYRKVELPSFKSLGDELTEVKNTLQKYAESDTVISCNGNLVDAKLLFDFCEYYNKLNRQNFKKRQKEGIERALMKKAEGNGCYGRPKVELPSDFDEQIIKCKQNKVSLANYCEKIQMKRSTFYKYAKVSQENQDTEKKVL